VRRSRSTFVRSRPGSRTRHLLRPALLLAILAIWSASRAGTIPEVPQVLYEGSAANVERDHARPGWRSWLIVFTFYFSIVALATILVYMNYRAASDYGYSARVVVVTTRQMAANVAFTRENLRTEIELQRLCGASAGCVSAPAKGSGDEIVRVDDALGSVSKIPLTEPGLHIKKSNIKPAEPAPPASAAHSESVPSQRPSAH
jgi:hypothetical protein